MDFTRPERCQQQRTKREDRHSKFYETPDNLVGVSSGAYWGYAVLVAIATVVGGFEHQDGWGGADRGVVAGLIYGIALLLVHAITGTHAKVSLGSFPPLLAVVTAIAGMLLSALGGRIVRGQRERRTAPAG